MSRRLARLALALYPLAFRRRYGAEMSALIDDGPARPWTALNLLRGALAAHLRPPAGLRASVAIEDQLRASLSGLIACWVAFATAGVAYVATTHDVSFDAGRMLGVAQVTIIAGAVAAALAIVLGTAPLARAALAHARGDRRARGTVAVPALAAGGFVVATLVLMVVAQIVSNGGRSATAPHLVGVAWGALGLVCAAIFAVGCRRTVMATPITRHRLSGSLGWGALVTVAMLVITAAAAVFAVALPPDAPGIASSFDGPLQATTVSVSVFVELAIMALTASLATVVTYRCRQASHSG